jgi:integrase
MTQPDAWRMIRRRAAAAGIAAPIGNHTFRATGITAYLANGGALEHAQAMAAHESPRTQGNRVKKSPCDEASEEVVIPSGGLTLEPQ